MRLKNRVAIITGAARGIGAATASLFAQEGAQVIIWDVLDLGAKTAEQIRQKGGKADFTKLSVTDSSGIQQEVHRIMEQHAQIDILINNAGILRDKTLLKMEEEDWQSSLDVNLGGVFKCTKAVVPHMKAKGYGRIVSASSITGMRGNYGQSNYAAAKAGIIGLTKTWAVELGRFGITANVVAPGFTETEMVESIPSEVKAQITKQIPVGFLGSTEDIAHAYLYLASEEARYVNGVCLNVDGGMAR